MVVITVCIGSSCYLKGAHAVAECLQEMIESHGLQGRVELRGTFCLNNCKDGVAVTVDGVQSYRTTPDSARQLFLNYIVRGGSDVTNNS